MSSRELGEDMCTPFEFSGTAYMCGIMDGEAMAGLNRSNASAFVLR